MRKMRLTTRIFSSSTSSPSRAALSLKPYFTRCPAMTFPSRALRSLPRLLRSAILARSYLPSWSSMPSVSSPSGDSSPRSLSAYLRPVLLELALEQVVVGGLAGEAVAVLRQHQRNSALGHEVAHPVHAGALQARPALARVPHLPEDLVPLARRVLAQQLEALRERVAAPGLLGGRDAGVEDRPLGAATVGAR